MEAPVPTVSPTIGVRTRRSAALEVSDGAGLALTPGVPLAVRPPLAPMLARLSRELPQGDFVYEPKWDGFRALVFRDGTEVDVRSRHGSPFSRYFPELVEALAAVPRDTFVLDGEILVVTDGRFDFAALMTRVHPARSRVERLSVATPASFVAFDLIAIGDEDLRPAPFAERRARLETLLGGAPPRLLLTPITDDRDVAAQWLTGFEGGGVDGVVAKHRSLGYEAGRRSMIKIKHERTADCVVAGFRWQVDPPATLGSLLLGVYDPDGSLRHVGVTSAFTSGRRRELLEDLRPLVTALAGHPWEHGFGLGRSPVGRLAGSAGRWTPDMTLDWIPVRPERVCEVAYDTLDGDRFRHPARFRRWRPDRDPASCTFEQFGAQAAESAVALDVP